MKTRTLSNHYSRDCYLGVKGGPALSIRGNTPEREMLGSRLHQDDQQNRKPCPFAHLFSACTPCTEPLVTCNAIYREKNPGVQAPPLLQPSRRFVSHFISCFLWKCMRHVGRARLPPSPSVHFLSFLQ